MKKVPLKLEEAFIATAKEIKALQRLQSEHTGKLISYHEKGYGFSLLTHVPETERVNIPWKTIAMEFASKYLTISEHKKWLRRIKNKYTPTPVAAYFKVPKEADESKDQDTDD